MLVVELGKVSSNNTRFSLLSEFTSRCSINKSLFNSQQFDSELDLICPSPPLTPSPQLTPGLTTKPPVGPQQAPPIEEDIVDLKFRNWFPNSLKYPNELPVFIPDSRISTNDIPTTCRSAAGVKGSLAQRRHAKSDNFLNRIGCKDTDGERYAKTEAGDSARDDSGNIEERNEENCKNDRREVCEEITFNEARLTHDRGSETFPKETETFRESRGFYGHSTNQKNSAAVSSDNEDGRRRHERNSRDRSKQMIRSNSNREYNGCHNHDGSSHNVNRFSEQTSMYGYYKQQQSESYYNGEEKRKETHMYTYRQGDDCNGYNQGDISTRGYNSQGIDTIHEDIGATSNEYYIEYKPEHMNKDSDHQEDPRLKDNGNELFKNEPNKENSYETEEYQEYWRKLAESGRETNNFCNKIADVRERTTPDSFRIETSKAHWFTDNGNYSRDKDNARYDSCTRNKSESPETYSHNNECSRKCHNSKEILKTNVYESPDHIHEDFSQNNADTPNETDSARSEETHYTKSMDVLDKIYSSKKKDRLRHGKVKQPKLECIDTTTDQGNKILHRNAKRKSLESLNSRFSKFLSEEVFTRANEISTRNHLDYPSLHEAKEENSQVNYEKSIKRNVQEEVQDVSQYLEKYDFEQDERILNHILEKSKHKPVPQIRVTDASKDDFPVKDINSSTYNEIVDILKVLESEENVLKPNCDKSQEGGNSQPQVHVHKDDKYSYQQNKHSCFKQINNSQNNVNTSVKIDEPLQAQDSRIDLKTPSNIDTETIRIKDIYSFLDQVDNQASIGSNTSSGAHVGNTSKLSELMKLSSADLAQKYLTLSINMDEKQIIITALEKRIEQIDKHCKEMKTDSDATVKRLQKFIAQLIKEKKDLSEQCAEMCKDMDKKYKQIIETMEERHKIEIKKNTDKHLAAEKIRREKWIDNKTQKIKELTVKGLEPELLKMTNAHQEEIAELRKAHNRQIEENDGMWNRKITTMKEKFEEDLQNAILQERENNRKRLDEEIKTMENNYQQQRQHLLNEVRIERENLDRQAEDMRNEKEKELNQKLEKMANKNKEICEKLEHKHQDDIKKLKEDLNQEKQLWIETKTAQNEEKEQLIREQCKRERDKHIELIIQKLEKEQTERNNAADAKLKNMKEQHEKDVEELEAAMNNVKTKLNETRTKLQNSEDQVTELKTQVHGLQIENRTQGELLAKLRAENHNLKLKSDHETNDKINRLEEEIEQTRRYFETLVDRMKKDQERELSLVYGRVKETISKKDEAIHVLSQQKQAALTQCASLEAILAQRKH